MDTLQGFPPLLSTSPHTLILGSMPGQLSLQQRQYYAHPRNTFWSIVGEILDFDAELAYSQRVAEITAAGFIVWDVLKHCERQGSLDTAIVASSVVTNDFVALLAAHRDITRIFFNGAKAGKLFNRHVVPTLRAAACVVPDMQQLPSTSPAHAALNRGQKLALWRAIFPPPIPSATPS